jgi:PKD repeat protein
MSIVSARKTFLNFFVLLQGLFCSASLFAQPVANFSATPVSGCSPLLVQFTDISTGNPTSWKWDLGNGTTSVIQNPSTTYFEPGQYRVTLTATNAAGENTIVKDEFITVYFNPTIDFTGDPLTGCFPLSVQFTDQSLAGSGTLTKWEWDFGDGTTGSGQNPQHIYTAAGISGVTLTATNSFGCTNSLFKSQYINIAEGVIADFSNDVQNTCKAPATLNFQNFSSG